LHGGPRPSLCFNYQSDYTRVWDDTDLKDEHGYETTYPDAGPRQGLRIVL
jgi:hypothetical protein